MVRRNVLGAYEHDLAGNAHLLFERDFPHENPMKLLGVMVVHSYVTKGNHMKPTTQDLKDFASRIEAVINAHYAESKMSLRTSVAVMAGRKYARIVRADPQRSCYCFIDMENGDVFMSAGWKAPAKHARGNLFDEFQGMKKCNPYGVDYLNERLNAY